MNKCESCKHWDTSDQYDLQIVNVGECRRVKMFWDSTEWVRKPCDGEGRKLKEAHKDDKAFVQDGSDYTASLYTVPDFGCVQWEPKP